MCTRKRATNESTGIMLQFDNVKPILTLKMVKNTQHDVGEIKSTGVREINNNEISRHRFPVANENFC